VIDPAALIARFGLAPLPVEGGLFRQWYRSADLLGSAHLPARYAGRVDDDGKPAGTAIVAMLTDEPDSFSAFHRLATDELWHFYLGDPLELVLLHPGGSSEHIVLGADVLGGEEVFAAVPRGSWLGARLVPGGRFALFGNTMAPGFTSGDFEGADVDELVAGWPHEQAVIHALYRACEPREMPRGL
jgi:uncharacterized protein